jgi:hypothetical protein
LTPIGQNEELGNRAFGSGHRPAQCRCRIGRDWRAARPRIAEDK